MSDNVVSLHGAATHEAARPIQGLVAELERLLEAAKAGEIVGFAGACQHRSAAVSYAYAGAVGGYAMIGGLECVRHRLVGRATCRD